MEQSNNNLTNFNNFNNFNDFDNFNNFSKMRKSIVNYIVIIFGLVIMLIFILLGIYYLTPNNYIIRNWEYNKFINEYDFDPNTNLHNSINLDKTKNEYTLTIKPNAVETIILDESKNEYLKFNEPVNLIVKNSFKSQSICFGDKDELISTKYGSKIILTNDSANEKKITFGLYSFIE